MADSTIYLVKVDGEESIRLYRSTDPRLVRRAVIDSLPQPDIEVRKPTIPEAMDAALDGVQIINLLKQEAPAEPDLLDNVPGSPGNVEPNGADATGETGGSARLSEQSGGDGPTDGPLPIGADEPRLAPGEWIDNDGEIRSAEDDDTPF